MYMILRRERIPVARALAYGVSESGEKYLCKDMWLPLSYAADTKVFHSPTGHDEVMVYESKELCKKVIEIYRKSNRIKEPLSEDDYKIVECDAKLMRHLFDDYAIYNEERHKEIWKNEANK